MKTTKPLLYLCLSAAACQGQVITTVAGTDWVFPTYSLPALAAPMGRLSGMVLRPDGSFLVSDGDNSQIFKITAGGMLSVYAGNGQPGFSGEGGPAVNASLATQQGIAVDGQGNLYVADTSNQRVRKVDTNGVITTVAGNGNAGFAGDGGLAISAQLSAPWSVAVDGSGALYIADSGNNRIRKVAPNGLISTFAGNGAGRFSGDGAALTSSLNSPRGVLLDGAGNLYIADTLNNRIRKIGADGMLVTVVGNGQGGFAGDGGPASQAHLSNPWSVTMDASGNLYIADIADYRVRQVTTDGRITTIAGNGGIGFSGDGGPATQAQITPVAVAVGAGGTVYIADQTNERIRAVTNGTINTIAGTGFYRYRGDGGMATAAVFNNPTNVGFDAQGNLYLTDQQNDAIRMIQPGGTIGTFAGTGAAGETGNGGPAKSATLYAPWGLGLDANGNVYFTEPYTNYVRKVDTSGIITKIAGTGNGGSTGDNAPAVQAQVNGPRSVASDLSGNTYIAEDGSSRIRKISPTGVITTVAGNGTAGFAGDEGLAVNAQINHPASVAADSAGNLYIADFDNQRVRKVTTDGKIHTVAGNGNMGSSGDGGLATAAQLNVPVSVAVDNKGNLFIGEHEGHRVRKVTPNGTISTVAGNGILAFSGDGGAATSASISQPYGLAVDGSGNLFIADMINGRIREVLATAPGYAVSPTTLNFTATAGAVNPAPQTVTMSALVTGLPYAATTVGSWLSVTPAVGSVPSALGVNVDTTGLAAGNYTGSITVAVPSAVPAATSVAVSLTVAPGAAKPVQAVSPGLVAFTGSQGGSPQTVSLQISNTGSGSLSYTLAASTSSGGNWLSASSTSGAATPSAPSTVTLTATPGSLAAGTYSGQVAITGGGSTTNVPVTLSIAAANPIVLLSQTALSFTAVAQGGTPLPQSFGILNTGTGTMNWSATASGGTWLQISPASGTVQTPYTDVSMVSVAVNPAGLAAGNYSGTIQVSAASANSPQVMTVFLTVMPAGSNPGPDVRPAGLIFTGSINSAPGSQDVMVGNPKGSMDNFISGSIGQGFSYVPTNAIVAPSQPSVVRVVPSLANLTPGQIARGTITLQFSDGTPRTISVLTVVAPTATAGTSSSKNGDGLTPQASGSCSGTLQVVSRSLRSNFAAIVGQPTTVEVQVIDSCGNLAVPVNPSNPSVSAFFSNGDDKVALTHVGNGVWTGTWRPVNAGAGSVSVAVNATWIEGTSPNAGTVSVGGTLTAAGKTPLITAGGVVHAASFVSGAPIAPGGLVTIYGANLSDSTAAAQTLPLPQQLSGAQAMLGNIPVPLVYASSGQMNVQIPFDTPVNTQYQLTVTRDGNISVPQSLVVAAAQPGVFATNQAGSGQGVILKADGVTIAQPATPAKVGEALTIYCTGLGAVSPSVASGVPAPTSPLSRTVNPVTVTIGGQTAMVLFAGLTPGSAGLYQVNAVVPAGVSGDTVPVVMSVSGQTSPMVTISVH
jgi:trimeric autotransporter adhesin